MIGAALLPMVLIIYLAWRIDKLQKQVNDLTNELRGRVWKG
jgi:hypothetical protein